MVQFVRQTPAWVRRAAVVAALVVFLVLYLVAAAHAQPVDNPLDGTNPDPSDGDPGVAEQDQPCGCSGRGSSSWRCSGCG